MGKSLDAIAKPFGISRHAVRDRAMLLGCYGKADIEGNWAPSTTQALVRLWGEKNPDGSFTHSASSIGRRLNRTTSSITGKAHRMGLEARPSCIAVAAHPDAPRWAQETGCAPERFALGLTPLAFNSAISKAALDAVFDQRRFAE
jgi:hypothetical protein